MKRALKPKWHLYVVIKAAIILFVLMLCMNFSSFSHTFATPQRVQTSYYRIPGIIAPLLQHHTAISRTAGNKVLDLSVNLVPRNQSVLDALLLAQSQPNSPLYHHYLTPSEFQSQFGQTPEAVTKVVNYLRSRNITVTAISPNNLLLKATGTVTMAEKAFAVNLDNYALAGRVVFSPTLNPAVPDTIAPIIQNIAGLDDVSIYQPHVHAVFPNKMHHHTGPGGGYTPSELRTAYDVNPLINAGATGAGQTVAIFELDGYTPSDINTYLSNYNLGSSKYSNVLLDGATNTPGSGAVEVTLDMEIASALAPNASQKIYIGPNSTTGVNDLYNRIVTDNVAKVVSTSWGQCEAASGSAEMNALNNIFQQGAAQGQSFFAASGDSGAYDCGDGSLSVDSPADEPNVVGVGGTNLVIANDSTYKSESAWSTTGNGQKSGGGGGVSNFFPRPAYQNGTNLTGTKRMVPDVSADADPASGYAIFCSGNSNYCNGWGGIGGTSAAAPLWAGIAADMNQYLLSQNKLPLGNVNASLYTLYNTPQAYAPFHDVVTGQNLYYQAVTGYDLATGLGTPDAWNIVRNLAGNSIGALPTPTAQPLPTPTTLPLPTLPPTSTPLPVTPPTMMQLLQNTGFESPTIGWKQRSGRGSNLIDATNPHTGKSSAHLCGYANCNDELYQSVKLPRTMKNLTLSYWVYIGNRSTSTTCSSNLYVILYTQAGYPIALVQNLCNTSAHGWVQYSANLNTVLAAQGGQTVQLYFDTHALNQIATSFYVDDVAFNVTS